jgi:hypothetical protein
MRKLLVFLALLFVTMCIGFGVHAALYPLAKTFLIQSYSINTAMALTAIFLLGWGINKKKTNLAILYLLTVALKFCVYFLFFYPQFQEDGILIRREFFIFFIPYAIGLVMEIIFLAKRYT